MSIVRAIARAHDGEAVAANCAGGGAIVVSITFALGVRVATAARPEITGWATSATTVRSPQGRTTPLTGRAVTPTRQETSTTSAAHRSGSDPVGPARDRSSHPVTAFIRRTSWSHVRWPRVGAAGWRRGGSVDVEGGLDRRGFLRAAVVLPVVAVAACSPDSSATPASPAPPATSPPTPVPGATGSAGAPAPPTGEVAHAGSGRPQVALTFHGAGDLALARRVLTLLHDGGAAVTVLAVGTWLQRYPDAVRLVTDLGHELGNHTWSHPDLAALDEPSVRVEIERCRDRIVAATGGPGAFFRPSQAQHATPRVLRAAAAAGYPRVLSYDVDSRDFTDPGPAAVRRAVREVTAGAVVSLHLGHPGTADALPGVLDDLAGRGLTPVTAGTLFS